MADMKKKTYPTTNGNLAFDLDVLVRERELETAGEHNRRQEEVRRAEAQPKPRTRPQARPRQRVSPVLLAGTMVLAALASSTPSTSPCSPAMSRRMTSRASRRRPRPPV